MKTFARYLVFLLWTLRLANAASGAELLTLDDALRAARANNPRLRSALQGIESAAGRAEQRGAWPNPQISLSAEDVPRSGSLSDGKNLVGISQTIPFPLKPRAEGRAGRSEIEESRFAYDLFAVGLERDVKIAFYRAVAAQQSLIILREVANVAEHVAAAARKRVDAGDAPLQEQLRAEIELERARSEVLARERQLDPAIESLLVFMGQPPREVSLAGELSSDTSLADPELDREQTDPHPLLAGIAARVGRAENELQRARLDPLPDVDLRFAVGRDGAENDVMEMEAGFSIPLFNLGGGLRREKRAELEAARADLAATHGDFEASRRNATARFRAAAEQVAAYRDRILPRAEQALALVQGGFDAGKFGFIDLLDTQRTLAEVRLAYIEKLLDLNSARAEWESLRTTSPKTPSTE